MADLVALRGDRDLLTAVDRIWDSAVNRKLYVTGGVGASGHGEAFAGDYDLPNDTAYCESCAGCGLVFWAARMHALHHHGRYLDVLERALYNNVLGAVELSGVNFFYQNPLASDERRYPWHGCPCCVGNIPRTLLALKDHAYCVNPAGDTLYVNHYLDCEGTLPAFAGTALRLDQRTGYPWSGEVTLVLHPTTGREFTVNLRVPSRCESALYRAAPELAGRCTVRVNGARCEAPVRDGYATVRRLWQPGDRIELSLPMELQRVRTDERLAACRGLVALQRGPLVYNVEDADHGGQAQAFVLAPDAPLSTAWKPELLGGVVAVTRPDGAVVAVPNFARLNRDGWSQVWLPEDARYRPVPFVRPELEARTVDRVEIGVATAERAHGLKGERTSSGRFQGRRWRHAVDGGWFSYELKIAAAPAPRLLCTYWGSDVGNRRFDVLVEGQKVASQVLQNVRPGEFFDVEVALPEAIVADRERVTVTLRAEPGATAGGVFDLRIVRPAGP